MRAMTKQEEHVEVIQLVYAAMLRAEAAAFSANQYHLLAFEGQMRDIFGVAIKLPEEPYLEYEQKRFELQLLETLEGFLERVERHIYHKATALDDIMEYGEKAAFDPKLPPLPQVKDRVDLETVRMQGRLKQSLDNTRQQAVGVSRYIWHSQDDARVRPEHAANDGKEFTWANKPKTGHPGEDYNCRCWAEPSPRYPDAIEPVYPELLLLGGVIGHIGRILNTTKGKLDKAEAKLPKKPVEKPKPGQETPRSTLNESQAQNLARFEKKLPKDAKPTKVITDANGNKVLQSDVPAKNIPGSFARYEKTIDANGKTIAYKKTTYGPDGKIIHVKDKMR